MQAMNASNRWTFGWRAEDRSVKSAARCGTLGGAATSLASDVSGTRVNMASAACQEHVTWIMCVFKQHSDHRTVVQNQTYLQQHSIPLLHTTYVCCMHIYIYIYIYILYVLQEWWYPYVRACLHVRACERACMCGLLTYSKSLIWPSFQKGCWTLP